MTLESTRPVASERDFVQALSRGLSVIRALSRPAPGLTISEVSRATGLSRGTVRRSLLTLEQVGYVHAADGRFVLTPRVLELGYAYLSSVQLPKLAQPHLEALAEEVQESTGVSVLDGDEIVAIGGVTTKRVMTISIRVGGRLPAHATAAGRVLLAALPPEESEALLTTRRPKRYTEHTVTDPEALRAELERTREQGWAIVDQEFEEGFFAIAAPVRDASGDAVAAVSVLTQPGRTAASSACRTLLPALQETVAAIERDLALVGHARR
jgi:IclR family transcriptional regulator, pca regulon regulatory protein